ncbi:hypothetical protein M2139_001491 [Enterococcus sp. PF1-24]|uniref:ATPase n=1 Tax=unclassified Enterococcus TaxID=2608891 RepID=UPI002474D29D|nr:MULTISPECIES: ATPase [unclassified Enterococcus]MDH6364518.1 hypothetical protein [Enterococcus sp. PFB1-1]MDH6401605.1 hypothetical protein [Enterococcus sp. PF1-24]
MLTKKKMQQLRNEGYDLDFVSRVKPQGGITFKNNLYVQTGDGYSCCLHVFSLPTDVPQFWLTNLTENLNTITSIHLATANKEKVLRSINLTLSEYKDRMENERTYTSRNDASNEFFSLQDFAAAVTQGGEIIKMMKIRIHISADTIEDLERQKKEIRKQLSSKNYKATTFLFEEKEEWLSLFESSAEQESHFSSRDGLAVPATAIGGGYPFNHQYLIDDYGGYVGTTASNGAFIYNPFHITDTRTSFSGIGVGLSGSGKSTLLKMMEEYLFGANNIVRGIEKNKDWYKLIHSQNGKIIDMSGKNGVINIMEVLGTRTDITGKHLDELGSYMQHKSKFMTTSRFLNPVFEPVDILMFGGIFDAFYVEIGMLEKDYMKKREGIKITGLPSNQYPTVEEFRDFYKQIILEPEYRSGTEQKKRALESFGLVLDAMVNEYGAFYNGHTTFKNFENEDVLFFDIDSISGLSPEVFHSQLFTILNLNWNQAMKNGRKMKNLLDNKEITAKEVRYFMFFLDECQNILNKNNPFAVEYIVDFLKEMRKFSAGTFLMTQSPQELLPEGNSGLYSDKVKQVFELCNTKMFLRMDESVVGRLKNVLGSGYKDSDYATMQGLKKGQVLFSFGAGETYKVNVDPTEEQLIRFAGGH